MYRSSYKSLTYVWISDTGEDAIAGRGVASWRQIYFSRICTRGNRGLSISHDAVFNPLPVRFFNLNFHPLEDASRYRDPQLQVGKNYSYLFTLRPNTNEFLLIKHLFISQKKLVFSWMKRYWKRVESCSPLMPTIHSLIPRRCSFNSLSAGIDFRHQNLTSTDVRFWRLKSIYALKRVKDL